MANFISEQSRDKIVALGTRFRSGYLTEQAGYTLELARQDGRAMLDLAPDGYLEAVADALEKVRAAQREKALMAEESKGSTIDVNDLLRRAKDWRRDVVNRCQFAERAGKRVPAGLTRMKKLSGVPAVADSLNQMVKWLESCMDCVPGKDVKNLIAQGRNLAAAINATDAVQETKRTKQLSDKVAEFCYQKGLLYLGVKGLNDLGRSVHRGDPRSANKYDLSILYRHMNRKNKNADQKASGNGKG